MATLKKYNPGFLTDEELVDSFCVREHEFKRILKTLRECTGSANSHQLVIGPRGFGKTSLLLRAAAEIRRNRRLRARFLPVVFAEECYEISTFGEFWLECIARLGDQPSRQLDALDWNLVYEELRDSPTDEILAKRCLGVLLDFANRADKRLVIVAENINMLFAETRDPKLGWRLRKVLQTEPRIILLASATSRFNEIDDPKMALYEFFRTLCLKPLDASECRALWRTVAGEDVSPRKIRPIQILTGGNPRLVVMVARLGAGLSIRNLMHDMLELIDDHTGYFKGHLDGLPPQERRVYLALAGLWAPAATKEIAAQARLTTNTCSAQLARLVDRGVVADDSGTQKRKQYYLTERLYNIYYLLRSRTRMHRLVEAFILFMQEFYSRTELDEIVEGTGGDVAGQAGIASLLAGQMHSRLLEMRKHWKDEGAKDGRKKKFLEAAKFLEKLEGLADEQAHEEVIRLCDEVLEAQNSDRSTENIPMVAVAYFGKVPSLYYLRRYDEACRMCDAVLKMMESDGVDSIPMLVELTLANKAWVLMELNRPDDALDALDEATEKIDSDTSLPAYREEAIVQINVTRGHLYWRMGKSQEALDVFEALIKEHGTRKEVDLESIEAALIGTAYIELSKSNHTRVVDLATQIIDRHREESWTHKPAAYSLRAIAYFEEGNQSAGICDVKDFLKVFPKNSGFGDGAVSFLAYMRVWLNIERMLELIEDSPSAELLLPYTTALRMERGEQPKVAQEVTEVANDIRERFSEIIMARGELVHGISP